MSKKVKQKSPTAAAKVMIAYKIVWELFCLIVINNPPKFAVIRSLVYYIINHRIFQGQGSQVYVNNGKKAEVTRRRDSGGANPHMGNIPIFACKTRLEQPRGIFRSGADIAPFYSCRMRRRDSGGANPRMGNIPISASRNAVGTTARNISERRRMYDPISLS